MNKGKVSVLAIITASLLLGCGSESEIENSESEDIYGTYQKDEYFDASNIMEFSLKRRAHIYEAEAALLSEDFAQVEGNESASRGQNVGYLSAGETVTFPIVAEEEAEVLITACIATTPDYTTAMSAEDYFMLTVYHGVSDEEGDDIMIENINVEPTGSWTAFQEIPLAPARLSKGLNNIELLFFGGCNLDYIVLTPRLKDFKETVLPFSGAAISIKASDSFLSGCRLNETKEFAEWTNTHTKIEFSLECDNDYDVALSIRALFGNNEMSFSNALSDRLSITCNKESLDLSSVVIESKDEEWYARDPDNISVGNAKLKKGINSFSIASIGDCYNFYSVEVN